MTVQLAVSGGLQAAIQADHFICTDVSHSADVVLYTDLIKLCTTVGHGSTAITGDDKIRARELGMEHRITQQCSVPGCFVKVVA